MEEEETYRSIEDKKSVKYWSALTLQISFS